MITTMIASKACLDIIDDIRRMREYKKQLEAQEKYMVQKLYNIVNEHERVISVDENGEEKELATWKYSNDSKRFDGALFKEERPDLYEQYVKIQPGARILRIKE